jgi:hypothetical protein
MIARYRTVISFADDVSNFESDCCDIVVECIFASVVVTKFSAPLKSTIKEASHN